MRPPVGEESSLKRGLERVSKLLRDWCKEVADYPGGDRAYSHDRHEFDHEGEQIRSSKRRPGTET